MKTKAALLWEQPGEWDVCEIELDAPHPHEVLVRMVATGLCHSDDHNAKGDLKPSHFPFCGGHEGAGVVEAVGSKVRDVKPGDHIVTAFIPSCGHCRWCASGLQSLCDNGGRSVEGRQLDGTYRMHIDGKDIAQGSMLGAFSEYTVFDEGSCVKVDDDISLTVACLVACGVPTGWGSAVNAAAVQPGDVVIVMGIGGIGINAVQGARHAGATQIIAVDPVKFKREKAIELGATVAVETIEEATDLAREHTNGQGADSAIITIGVPTGSHVGGAFSSIRKAGTVVLTGAANISERGLPINLFELTMYQKRIQGALYGGCSAAKDIPRLLSLYRSGQLRLDELVTRTYPLEQINQGYADMHAGLNIRGVLTFDG